METGLGQIVVAAILTAALAGLAALGAILVGLRQAEERRRAERLFEAAGRVLEHVDNVRVLFRHGHEMAGAIDIAKSRVVFHIAELRVQGISRGLEDAVRQLELIAMGLTDKSSPATMNDLERTVVRFQEAVAKEHPRR